MSKCKLENVNWKMSGRKRSGIKFNTSEGFTLIEMIVSLAIFSIVAVVALGALMKIVSANKKAQSLQSAMTNINYALESISREMRVGSDFSCTNQTSSVDGNYFMAADCPGVVPPTNPSPNTDGLMIAFRSSRANTAKTCNLIYAYHFLYDGKSWDLRKATQPDGSSDCTDPLTSQNFASIIDPNVIITGYYMNVTADMYPLASLRISGYVGARELERTYFNVQTAVSSRVPSGQ